MSTNNASITDSDFSGDITNLSGVEDIPQETRLRVVEWVFRHLYNHAHEGGTFRYLIYDRLNFGPEAYVPLYQAGGMTISDELDISHQQQILDLVRQHNVECLKPVLALCDYPGCYQSAQVFSSQRQQCGKHSAL